VLLSGGSASAVQPEAADVFKAVHTDASATWWSLEPDIRFALITVRDDRDHTMPGRPVLKESVSVVIWQDFCDEATDEDVVRRFTGNKEADIQIHPSLESASVDEPMVLDGVESRASGCSNSGLPTPERDIGDFAVRVSAQWSGVGPVDRYQDVLQLFPTCKFWTGGAFRYATATGSITGDLDVGALGTTESRDAHFSSLMFKSLSKDEGACFEDPNEDPNPPN